MDNKIQNIPAIILAGGKSSRMGQDKALMPFKDCDTLALFQYNKLISIFKNVFISSKHNKFDLFEEKQLILDSNNLYSPMIALETIFENLDYEKFFIISVDTPFISQESIIKLIDESSLSSHQIFLAKDKEGFRHPLCAVFDKTILPIIKTCLKQNIHKINYLIDQCDYKELTFENNIEFLNMNTMEEYKRANSFTIT